MKAILYSIMVVALVGGMVGGGLFAYFSDTETSTGNTFSAGTIDIEVAGENLTFSNGQQVEFKPCEWGEIELTITNVGANPADIYKLIVEAVGEENGITEPEQEWYDANTVKNLSAADFEFDLTVDGEVWVAAADASPLDLYVGNYIYLGELAAGASMTVTQSLHMLGTTENYAQSDTLTLNEEFLAFQVPGDAAPAGTIMLLDPTP